MKIVERFGRQTIDTTTPWEPVMGYSRAVRSGNLIIVTGTVGILPDGSYPPTMRAQAKQSLSIIRKSLEALGGKIEEVIRTRIFTIDISRWREIAAEHGQLFREIRPATTLVEVRRLIDDQALLEIEAEAIISDAPRTQLRPAP